MTNIMNRILLYLALTVMQILLFHSNSHAICKEKITTPLARARLSPEEIPENFSITIHTVYTQPEKQYIAGYIFTITMPYYNFESWENSDGLMGLIKTFRYFQSSKSTRWPRVDTYYLPINSTGLSSLHLEKFESDYKDDDSRYSYQTVISSLPYWQKIKIPNRYEFGWINTPADRLEKLGRCIFFRSDKYTDYSPAQVI